MALESLRRRDGNRRHEIRPIVFEVVWAFLRELCGPTEREKRKERARAGRTLMSFGVRTSRSAAEKALGSAHAVLKKLTESQLR